MFYPKKAAVQSFIATLRIEPRTSYMLGKHPTLDYITNLFIQYF